MASLQREELDFKAAYEAHSDAIYRFCYFRLRDRERAVEIMQETFMKTWKHMTENGSMDQIRPFLYRVAKNLIIDWYKKKKDASLDDLTESGFDPGERDAKQGEDYIFNDELMTAVKALSPKYRDAVMMRFIEDMTPKEIGEVLGLSANVASVRIHLGLKELRKQFKKEL